MGLGLRFEVVQLGFRLGLELRRLHRALAREAWRSLASVRACARACKGIALPLGFLIMRMSFGACSSLILTTRLDWVTDSMSPSCASPRCGTKSCVGVPSAPARAHADTGTHTHQCARAHRHRRWARGGARATRHARRREQRETQRPHLSELILAELVVALQDLDRGTPGLISSQLPIARRRGTVCRAGGGAPGE